MQKQKFDSSVNLFLKNSYKFYYAKWKDFFKEIN